MTIFLMLENFINSGVILAIISVIIIPLIIWGVTVEKRLEKVEYNHKEISDIKVEVNSIKQHINDNKTVNQTNFDKVMDKLHKIELSVQNKKDK